MSAMLELKDLSKVYAMGEVDVHALKGVNLQVERGEFISIVGPSGSGKSTLLHILGALDVPTEGQYLLEGVDITELSDRELSRIRNKHFGFVFQSYNLYPELNALENVTVPMIYAGVKSKERKERAQKLLESVGLGHRLRHYPSQLSGGEQQRVAIARAMANNPTLILADEPTGNLATTQGQEVLRILCRLNDEGSTIVMVTHDPFVASHAKRLVALRDGEIVADQEVSERFTTLDLDFWDEKTA